MGITSKESRRRWISDNYTQVKVCVKPQIAAAFKAKCLAEGVSMSSQIIGFMAEKGNTPVLKKPAADAVFTRGQRRKAVNGIIGSLEKILDMETRYMDNIPENLRNSSVYETAEEAVSTLEEAVDLLRGAY